MRSMRGFVACGAMACMALSTLGYAEGAKVDTQHAVFVMTDNADLNEVISYERDPYGTLHSPRKFKTDGRGSGGKGDPLAAQGRSPTGKLSKLAGQLAADETTHFTVLNQALGRPLLPALSYGA